MLKSIKAFGYPHAEGIWLHIVTLLRIKRGQFIETPRRPTMWSNSMVLVVRLMWISMPKVQSAQTIAGDIACYIVWASWKLLVRANIRTSPVNLKKMQFPESIEVWDGKRTHINWSVAVIGQAIHWETRYFGTFGFVMCQNWQELGKKWVSQTTNTTENNKTRRAVRAKTMEACFRH